MYLIKPRRLGYDYLKLWFLTFLIMTEIARMILMA